MPLPSAMTFHALPPELLQNIARHLDRPFVFNLACTSRSLFLLLQPDLQEKRRQYRTISLKSLSSHMSWYDLWHRIDSDDSYHFIESLTLDRCSSNNADFNDPHNLRNDEDVRRRFKELVMKFWVQCDCEITVGGLPLIHIRLRSHLRDLRSLNCHHCDILRYFDAGKADAVAAIILSYAHNLRRLIIPNDDCKEGPQNSNDCTYAALCRATVQCKGKYLTKLEDIRGDKEDSLLSYCDFGDIFERNRRVFGMRRLTRGQRALSRVSLFAED